jgi:hypothetical protein
MGNQRAREGGADRTGIRKIRYARKYLVGKCNKYRLVKRPAVELEDNIKVDFKYNLCCVRGLADSVGSEFSGRNL